jgi:hypothetical protein
MERAIEMPSRIYWPRSAATAVLGLLAVVFLGAMTSGCTYTRVVPPPVYVEPEPEPYYEEPYYYDGPFADLSAHGVWIQTSPFGWVWQPYVGAGWQPYDYGNWAWTQWGWTWVTYEPFGWATYHYGFWHFEPVYGWIWIPGEQWFPARVSWMYYGDYILWAPIPPPGYYISDPWDVHTEFIWVGCHVEHFTRREVGRYKIRSPRHVMSDVPRVKIRREAPSIQHIEARTKVKVRTVDMHTEKFTKGGREYQQVVLPPAERENVVRYEKKVKDEVVKPQPRPETGKPTEMKKVRPDAGKGSMKGAVKKGVEPAAKQGEASKGGEKSKQETKEKKDDRKDTKETTGKKAKKG